MTEHKKIIQELEAFLKDKDDGRKKYTQKVRDIMNQIQKVHENHKEVMDDIHDGYVYHDNMINQLSDQQELVEAKYNIWLEAMYKLEEDEDDEDKDEQEDDEDDDEEEEDDECLYKKACLELSKQHLC
jgi:hypothetical protein